MAISKRIIKYEAAAGSGKTHQLTEEYLRRLFGLFAAAPRTNSRQFTRESLHRYVGAILAITFTNKAASEMKHRVLEKLKRFSLHGKTRRVQGDADGPLGEFSKQLGLTAERLTELSAMAVDVIISHFNDFNIKTIDSLMSSIIKVIAPDLDLPPDFEIVVDGGDAVREAARGFLEERCRIDWDSVRDALMDIKTSEKIPNWFFDEQIISYLVRIFEMTQSRGEVAKAETAEILEDQVAAWERFRVALGALENQLLLEPMDKGVNRYLNRRVISEPVLEEMRKIAKGERGVQIIASLLDKAIFTKEDAADLVKKDAPANYTASLWEKFQAAKGRLSDLIYQLSIGRVAHFSRFFSGFLDYWERDRGIVLVNEFSRAIRNKLLEWEYSYLPYIYLKLSDRFRHFLFDEFQDTSELQFKALLPVVEEVLSSEEASSLFLVGDRKQAIYRWRGGNAELMNEDRLRRDLDAVKWLGEDSFSYPLDTNWRSGPSIIEFINEFWDSGNLRGLMDTLGAPEQVTGGVQRNFAGARQKGPQDSVREGGGVSIAACRLPSGREKDAVGVDGSRILLEKCVEMVRELMSGGYRGCDIALLTRSNAEGRDIVQAFAEEGIPTLSDESMFLSSSHHINEIVSFFRFLGYPPDNLSFYNFVRGQIFTQVAGQRYPEEMAGLDMDRLGDVRTWPLLYKRFEEICPQTWESLLNPFLKQVGFSPPYDIFQDITHRFRLYENFCESAQFFLTFASLLHDLEQNEIHSLPAFLREWDTAIAEDKQYTIQITGDTSRVRVLTIHKAKGLEFPAVILPLPEKGGHAVDNLFWEDGRLYYITKNYAKQNPRLRDLYLKEVEKTLIDELNLLYVAFTRARDALMIPLTYKPPSAASTAADPYRRLGHFTQVIVNHPLVSDRLGTLEETGAESVWREVKFGDITTRPSQQVVETSDVLEVKSKDFLTVQWQKEFLVFAPAQLKTAAEKEAIRRGEAFHRGLAKIGRVKGVEELAAAIRDELRVENVKAGEIEKMIDFFCSPEVLGFFDTEMMVHNELDVAGNVNGGMEYRRVDRLMIGGDFVWIIDYKTGQEREKAHQDQVIEYAHIIKSVFPDREIFGFLLYIDLNIVVEVPC